MTAGRRFRSRRGATAGLGTLAALCALAAGADLVASDLPLAVRVDGRLHLLPCLRRPLALRDDDQQTLARRSAWMLPTPIPFGPLASHPGGAEDALAAPSATHLLGTDDRGRDIAARLVHGTRTALTVGVAAVALYLAAGLLVGAACAAGRLPDLLLARAIDVGAVVPAYFLLLAVQAAAFAGAQVGLLEVALAIAVTRWPEVARVTRAEALRVSMAPHVEAARAIGVPPLQIALRHVLPLAAGPAVVTASLGIGQAVLLETGLAFLGFGVPPPTPSWGDLLAQAHAAGLPAHLLLAPSIAIAVTVLAAGAVADGLQAMLDPRVAASHEGGTR